MKVKVVQSSEAVGLSGVQGDGKVQKASAQRHSSQHASYKVEENQEIKAYLNKLQELVPFMPKNKKLTKLEVITHVIDYIRDLRQTLGLPPCISEGTPFDLQSAMILSQQQSTNLPNNSAITTNPFQTLHHPHPRQPLCPISNLAGVTEPLPEIPAAELMDKSPSHDDVDTRPVSC